MSQPVFASRSSLKAVDLVALADEIERQYTPLAFQCACGGTDPSCRKVIEGDRYAMGQAHTAARIADFLRSQA